MGEAKRPGPLKAAFDNESSDAWSEDEEPFRDEPEQLENWLPPNSDEENERTADGEVQAVNDVGVTSSLACGSQPVSEGSADNVALSKWLEVHKG